MFSLCDSIEKYLVKLIENSPNRAIVIQRGRIAQEFDCAPSQINYVLTTRFNVFRGFIVESRRGGSGYVKIIRIPIDRLEPVVSFLEKAVTDLKEADVEGIVNWLEREGFITEREARLMKAAMVTALNNVQCSVDQSDKKNFHFIRSSILKEMLIQVLKMDFLE